MCKKKKKKPRINRPKFRVSRVREHWQWWLVASNGKIYATSGSYYWNRRDCLKAIKAIKNMASMCEIEVEE